MLASLYISLSWYVLIIHCVCLCHSIEIQNLQKVLEFLKCHLGIIASGSRGSTEAPMSHTSMFPFDSPTILLNSDLLESRGGTQIVLKPRLAFSTTTKSKQFLFYTAVPPMIIANTAFGFHSFIASTNMYFRSFAWH